MRVFLFMEGFNESISCQVGFKESISCHEGIQQEQIMSGRHAIRFKIRLISKNMRALHNTY